MEAVEGVGGIGPVGGGLSSGSATKGEGGVLLRRAD